MIGAGIIPLVLYYQLDKHISVLLTGLVMVGGLILARKLINSKPGPVLNPLLGATARLLLIYSVIFAVTWNL